MLSYIILFLDNYYIFMCSFIQSVIKKILTESKGSVCNALFFHRSSQFIRKV